MFDIASGAHRLAPFAPVERRSRWGRFSTSATVRTRSRAPRADSRGRDAPREGFGGNPTRALGFFLAGRRDGARSSRSFLALTSPPSSPLHPAAAKVYVASEAVIGLSLGLVGGAVWKVRASAPAPRASGRAGPRTDGGIFFPPAPARGPRDPPPSPPSPPPSRHSPCAPSPLLSQNWHWSTRKNIEKFYAENGGK